MWRPIIAPSSWDEANVRTICRGVVVNDVFREMGEEFIKRTLEAQGIQLQLSESERRILLEDKIEIDDGNHIFYAILKVLRTDESARNAIITALVQLATAEESGGEKQLGVFGRVLRKISPSRQISTDQENLMRHRALKVLLSVFDEMMSPLRDSPDWFRESHGKFTVIEDRELSLRILQVSFGDILPGGVSVDKLYEKMKEEAIHIALRYGEGEAAHRPGMERSLAFTRELREEIKRLLEEE